VNLLRRVVVSLHWIEFGATTSVDEMQLRLQPEQYPAFFAAERI
jgi:hypothetical protein